MKKYYADNYNRFVILLWGVIIVLFWLQYFNLSTLLEATLFLWVFIPAIVLSSYLTNCLLPRAMQRRKMKRFVFQLIGISIIIAFILAISYQIFRYAERIGYFPDSLLLADNNSFLLDFLFSVPSAMVINLSFCGLRFYREHEKLHKAHLEAQLQILQSQINPHFMFNVLNHIHVLMQVDTELASTLLLQYSDILRYQLYHGKNEFVRLQQEIQFLKDYIGVEKIRWGEKVKVSCEWGVVDDNWLVPPLLLITFVENAFKHVSHSITKENYIEIGFTQQANRICLEVENSKSELPGNNKKLGLGLENVRKRLDILYGENYSLTIQDTGAVYRSKLEIW